MSSTWWHVCSPDKHLTDCTESISLTETRPKSATGMLLIEFHPPMGKEPSGSVETEEALRWPHVISYS